MNKIIVSVLFLIILNSLVLSSEFTFYDDLGNEIHFNKYPQKIISLAPNITEIVFFLDKEEILKGITSACDYPKETNNITKIAHFSKIDNEKLKLISPEIAFVSYDFQGNFIKPLELMNIPVFYSKIENLPDLFDSMKRIGRIINAKESSYAKIDSLNRVYSILSKCSKNTHQVYIEIASKPLMTVSDKSFISNSLNLIGLNNVFSEENIAYPIISSEQVIVKNPSLIIVFEHGSISDIKKRNGWNLINAVKENRIIYGESDLLLRPGPRILLGLQKLKEEINEKSK